jgi:hypothetical protein
MISPSIEKKLTRQLEFVMYSQACVQRPPLGPEKSSRLTEVSDKTEI